MLGQQGNLSAALPHLQRATILRPESSEARYNLGAALWYSGAREKAIAELRESVRLDPGSAGGHAFLGMALLETGDLPGARASLQRALALSPAMAAAYVDLGIAFLREGNLEKGLGQLEAGLNVPSPVPPTPSWDPAIAALRQALALPTGALAKVGSSGQRSETPEAHNVLGLMLGRKGAPGDEVMAAFRAAIRIRPDYAEAHNNLGLVLIQSGNDEEGIAALREAVRLAPDYAEARDEPRSGVDADRCRVGGQGAGRGGPAGARIGEGPLQPCGGVRRKSHSRAEEGNRAPREGDRDGSRLPAGASRARQGVAAGREGDGSGRDAAERREARAEGRRGELPAGARAREGGPQGGRRGAAQERTRARRRRRPRPERAARHRGRAGRARSRRCRRGGVEVPARRPASTGLVGAAAPARRGARASRRPGGSVRRLWKGAGNQSARCRSPSEPRESEVPARGGDRGSGGGRARLRRVRGRTISREYPSSSATSRTPSG